MLNHHLSELQLVLRVLIASLLGGIIGWEREHHVRVAGIRTYSAIALGSCVFGLVSMNVSVNADPTRIAAQVVTGIGFIGAGMIFRQGGSVGGLTSAATIWATAAVGLATAFGMYITGLLTTIIIFLLLFLSRLNWWRRISGKTREE